LSVRLIVCLVVSALVTVLAAVFLYLAAVPLQFWQQLLLLLMLFGLVFVVSYYGGLLARRLGRQIRNWWHRPNLRRQLTILWASIRRLYRPRSKYDLPLFLLLTDDLDREKPILGKMGLKPIERIGSDSPVQYWLGEESAFITLDRGSTFAYPQLARDLGRALRRFRNRQPLNGIIVNIDCELLLDDSDAPAHDFASATREVLIRFSRAAGISAPVYTFLSGMSSLADFCQFFSTATEEFCDAPLGALIKADRADQFDEGQFNVAYARILQILSDRRMSSLASQLDADYRTSIAAAPLQAVMLKPALTRFFHQLTRSGRNDPPVWLRGLFLIDTVSGRTPKDLLAGAVVGAVGLRFTLPGLQVPSTRSLFVRNLINQALYPDSQAIGVRRGANLRAKLAAVALATGCIAILGFMIWSLRVEFLFKNEQFQQAIVGVNTYREHVKADPKAMGEASHVVGELSALRAKTYAIYQKKRPQTSFWIRNDNGLANVTNIYSAELSRFMLPMLAKAETEEIHQYRLNPSIRTLPPAVRAAAIYVHLARKSKAGYLNDSDQIEWRDKYEDFFLEAFSKLDRVRKAKLAILLQDIDSFPLGEVKAAINLQKIAVAELNKYSLAQVVYQLMRTERVSVEPVELISVLGTGFQDVFEVTEGTELFSISDHPTPSLTVPLFFTHDGFSALDLSTDSKQLRNALEWVKVLDPGLHGSLGFNGYDVLAAQVQQLYIRDYIDVWNGILESIHAKPVTSKSGLGQSLAIAGSASSSPLAKIVNLVNVHTRLAVTLPVSAGTTAKAPALLSKVEKTEKVVSGTGRAGIGVDLKQGAAKDITDAFLAYHKLAEPATKKTQVAILLQSIHKLNQWVQPFIGADGNAGEIFSQWADVEAVKANPLAKMRLSADNFPPAVKQWLVTISDDANAVLMVAAKDWLSGYWQATVYRRFHQRLAGKYPFDSDSKVDAKLDDVEQFFGKKGVIDSFITNWITPFRYGVQVKGAPTSFLWASNIELSPTVQSDIERAAQIRQALFDPTGKKLEVAFDLQVSKMSASLTAFSIEADTPLLLYRHGPVLWLPQHWPVHGERLQLQTNRGVAVAGKRELNSPWSWFKLLLGARVTKQDRELTIQLAVDSERIGVQVRLHDLENPFDSSLLPGYVPPEKL
jgi:type VI secretion system protein ImpL